MRASGRILVCLWLSVGLYAIAHVLPAITGDPWMFGWQASIACVEGATWSVLKGEPAWLFLFGWLPNPLFWLAVLWLLVRRRRNPRRAGIVTGLCGLAATACASLWFVQASLWFPNRERDGRLSVGYYAWLASMVLLTWAGFQAAAQVRPAPSPFPQTE